MPGSSALDREGPAAGSPPGILPGASRSSTCTGRIRAAGEIGAFEMPCPAPGPQAQTAKATIPPSTKHRR
jgi:hypothetical protein